MARDPMRRNFESHASTSYMIFNGVRTSRSQALFASGMAFYGNHGGPGHFAFLPGTESFPTAIRRVSAILPSVSASAERRRHPSTRVRNGSGRLKGRIDSCDRWVSVGTAILGNSVTPAPLDTIWARVDRLVARKPSSSTLLLEQYSST